MMEIGSLRNELAVVESGLHRQMDAFECIMFVFEQHLEALAQQLSQRDRFCESGFTKIATVKLTSMINSRVQELQRLANDLALQQAADEHRLSLLSSSPDACYYTARRRDIVRHYRERAAEAMARAERPVPSQLPTRMQTLDSSNSMVCDVPACLQPATFVWTPGSG
eukprot:TRINITY_DN710_c0_g1_i1.p1 TRINITY_DN710_c0_g1~~TRINITY_DN710_c0_g1_i1.p1  ORF type:complete len:167 (+),score=25.38 TRINITY_DN710_c0_g1_i1:91-591(+)